MSISSAMYIGVSGMNSFSKAIGVVSDNIANANSTAYKSNDVNFGDLVSSYYRTLSQDTDREGSGSGVIGITTDFSTGSMISDSVWSNLAINGKGFFNVLTTTGETLYTRDGSFHIDSTGYLVNLQGYNVLGADANPIRVEADPAVPVYSSYSVDTAGQVWGTPIVGGNAVAIGEKLRITTFPNQDGLIRKGTNLYSGGPETGAAVNGTAGNGICGEILDQTLEGSNVDIAAEMVSLIIYQADYNANSKTISTSASMMDTATNLVR